MAHCIVAAEASGPVLVFDEGLSFWGGVDPETGQVIDAHHPQHGAALAGAVVMMPTSRGSCSGSGVLLALALNGHAPAALVFREGEDILTLGALVAAWMYDRPVAVLRLSASEYDALAKEPLAEMTPERLTAGALSLKLEPLSGEALDLSDADRAMLSEAAAPPVRLAMRIICAMAAAQGAERLTDVSRAHIDGCIYHSEANLRFAEDMAAMDGRVCIPTTMNAISVDHVNWRAQGVPPAFGGPASRLADAYLRMGARPSFTCAPYLLEDIPQAGEAIAWAESNAVVYANSVLAARSVKHPDYLDLCMALTGRAPLAGVYLDANRKAPVEIWVERPEGADDAFWPLLGYLAGRLAPDRIPLLTGLEDSAPSEDDLKALCAAFGTTSAAAMLHVAGVTPEADGALAEGAARVAIARGDFARAWAQFNPGPERVELVAIGSPHASAKECRILADLLDGRRIAKGTAAIVTIGRGERDKLEGDGVLARLQASGVQVIPDLCWCSVTEPVLPPATRTIMTNSGKYAHYGPGLSGRAMRFGSLAQCAEAALTGRAPGRPGWINGQGRA
ncbi:aconitase X [Ruegeria sp. PrR005]|uniref:DUF521 domain-containing protein n=1 Tax=Ruegeria sp. PrR005 TaxID=2706882 RepID=A0A6B2NWN3_9RHOB|nr:aconitase family protein [Ruegeria sp. PrR005]NDW47858.1 DUF521 domain-containing protein [Ruegeria sp. PrR005]